MSGETDLGRILSTIEVRQREGVFVVVTIPSGDPLPDVAIAALISEVEGTTLVLDVLAAEAADLPYDFESAWLSVVAHTALDAVGVTAAVSTALAVRGIPCNMIAGFHHDHMLVPIGAVEDAIAAVSLIRAQHEAAQADSWGGRAG